MRKANILVAAVALAACGKTSASNERSAENPRPDQGPAAGSGVKVESLNAPRRRSQPKWKSLSKAERIRAVYKRMLTIPWVDTVPGREVLFFVTDYKRNIPQPFRRNAEHLALRVEFLRSPLSTKRFTPSQHHFFIKSQHGAVYRPTFGNTPKPDFNSIPLDQGEHVDGWILFKLKRGLDLSDLKLHYLLDGKKSLGVIIALAENKNPSRSDYHRRMAQWLKQYGMGDKQ